MTGAERIPCLICGAMALDRTPTDWDGVRLECENCGPYGVADRVISRLAGLAVPDRQAALARAQRWHAADPFPTIDSHCL